MESNLYYTCQWNQAGALAAAAHREFETWMDMVLLDRLSKHPKDVQLPRLAAISAPARNALLGFYLRHLVGENSSISFSLLGSP